jgi:hypothetical protein
VVDTVGHDPVIISRSTGMNLITVEGLAQALTGLECDATAWCASSAAAGGPGATS